jgi:L-alanine-DL-glutamate epimerase-like enolase superfamily enzyme
MIIDSIEIHEYEHQVEDVTMEDGHWVYEPGGTLNSNGFVLTISTDEGVEGNYRGFVHTSPMVAQIEMVAEDHLLGKDPRHREAIWYDLWHRLRHTDRLGIGPIDNALWDLAGKYYGESVSNLLGRYRDEIPAYASTYWADTNENGLDGPDAYASFARSLTSRGYTAIKMHPSGQPKRDRQICEAVREAVGDHIDLMLDPASDYETYAQALRVGRKLDELDFLWYEDPLTETGESMELSQKFDEELETSILGLEHVRSGPFGRADHLSHGATDFVRASTHLDAGVTGVMKIAAVTESFGLDVELHLGGAANVQAIGAIRNTNYFEHGLLHPQIDWMGTKALSNNINSPTEGTLRIPDEPGLGAEIDWSFVQQNLLDRTEFSLDQ